MCTFARELRAKLGGASAFGTSNLTKQTMNDNFAIQLFEGKKVRIVWDAEREKYYFAVADIVQVLTDSEDVKQYIKRMRARDPELNSRWGTICTPTRMMAADGKVYKTQAADIEGIFRIIQSIPSKKAEPVKKWLAEVGAQRIDQMIDPELSFQMAVEDYRRQGYSDRWINERMRSIEMRKELTDEWHRSGIHEPKDFATLTNVLTKAWSGMTTGEYKRHKGLTKENLRDNMTNVELALNTLAEKTDYQFRVKALYGEEGSIYLPISFATTMQLPHANGFEKSMNGWSMVNCVVDYTADYEYPIYTGIRSYANHEGNYGFFFNSTYQETAQCIVSPQFPDTTPLIVSFYYKDSNPSSGAWETFYVGYSTTTSDLDAFTWSEAFYAYNIPWKRYENTFPEGTRFIAIKYNTTQTSGLYIDDISVEKYLGNPMPTGLTVSNLTDTGATLSWKAPDANVTGYAYQYRKSSDDNWSDETPVQATTVTLSKLTENTTYNFRVMVLWSDNSASNYATTSFLTEGSVVNLPYTDGFENGMGSWRLVSTDQASGIDWSEAHDGGRSFDFHSAGGKDEYLYSPHFAGGVPIKRLFYFYEYQGCRE